MCARRCRRGIGSRSRGEVCLEVLVLYSGLHALWAYRVHHWLWTHGWRFPARAMSQFARLLTGIEIHPGAEMGGVSSSIMAWA